ncbi:M20/M25/M40 family metallo-hydrolase [Pseudoalteromonas sp. T1lg65]|uniref:M20/M25/M40 family metallo-hydrolase n=1 Tax=Pseudoalteromonas sp. T1lg65 TaxID=2077101 RepID=UPI003F792BD7
MLRTISAMLFALFCGATQASLPPQRQASGTVTSTGFNLINSLQLLTSAEHAGRKAGVEQPNVSARYIFNEFKNAGAVPSFQSFRFSKGFFSSASGHNVVVTLPCTIIDCEDDILISAHYDHLGTTGSRYYPGANDNASGTAALLYLAHQLVDQPLKRNVHLVATDAEESGLHGAKFYANQLAVNHNIAININLDMLAVGRNNRLYALLSRGAHEYKTALRHLTPALINLTVVLSNRQMERYSNNPRIDWHKASDHYAFYKQGIPYIYFGSGDDKHHHKTTDTLDNIDLARYEDAVKTINDFIASLAVAPLLATNRSF